MTDNNIQPNSFTLIRNMLRLITQNPDLEHVAPSILGEARILSQSDGGFYLVFEEPRELYVDTMDETLLPSDKDLLTIVEGLTQDINVSINLPQPLSNTYAEWVLIPVFQREKVIGLFSLVFREKIEISDENAEMLIALVDGLATVTQSAKASERHEKLTRNQYEFVRIVSHDLRSPLTSIKGFASILESIIETADVDEDTREKVLNGAEKIMNGVSQMTALVENIQDAGRYDPETGFYEMQRSPTDLVDIVNNIARHHLVPAEKEELTLTVKADPDLPIVNVDSNMIERSIINLVDNAIKYSPNGGNIELGIHKDGDNVIITVTDDGYGIPEENIADIFKKYTRVRRREHKRVKGSGLGLFIVRSVARHHGGDAFIESVLNEGSTFGIRIPLTGENLFGAARASAKD